MVNAAKMATKAFEKIEIQRLAGEAEQVNNVQRWNADYAEGSVEYRDKIRSEA